MKRLRKLRHDTERRRKKNAYYMARQSRELPVIRNQRSADIPHDGPALSNGEMIIFGKNFMKNRRFRFVNDRDGTIVIAFT